MLAAASVPACASLMASVAHPPRRRSNRRRCRCVRIRCGGRRGAPPRRGTAGSVLCAYAWAHSVRGGRGTPRRSGLCVIIDAASCRLYIIMPFVHYHAVCTLSCHLYITQCRLYTIMSFMRYRVSHHRFPCSASRPAHQRDDGAVGRKWRRRVYSVSFHGLAHQRDDGAVGRCSPNLCTIAFSI